MDEEELKPGQKFPTPTPGFGDRVFYETLLRQRPESAMAQEWCVAYGVLDYDEAADLHAVVLQRKRRLKMPGETNTKTNKTTTTKKRRNTQIIKDEAVDDAAARSEGIGSMTL